MNVDTETRRVLVYRLGSLGDMVVALPALHQLERAFPNAERRMLTNIPVSAKAPAAEAVLGASGLIHSYLQYPVGARNPFALARLAWSILRWRPQVVVYLAAARGVAAARRDAGFFRLCGVRRLLGVPRTLALQGNFYGAESDAACVNDWEPEALRLLRCLAVPETAATDRAATDPASWDLRLTPAERAVAAAALGPLVRPIAVSVGTKVQAKDWGRDNWRALLEGIARLPAPRHDDVAPGLLLLGSADEYEASESAAAGWRAGGGSRVVNLCGQLSPRESAAALERAAFFLGHDSGPMHLAAAVGTPCVAIFAARNIPRQWFPFGARHRVLYREVACAGCGLETCIVEGKRCLHAISVADVLAEVEPMLAETCPGQAMEDPGRI